MTVNQAIHSSTHALADCIMLFYPSEEIDDRPWIINPSKHFFQLGLSPSSFVIKKQFPIAWDTRFEKHFENTKSPGRFELFVAYYNYFFYFALIWYERGWIAFRIDRFGPIKRTVRGFFCYIERIGGKLTLWVVDQLQFLKQIPDCASPSYYSYVRILVPNRN